MRFAYPVMLDVTERPIVIVGGGAVAARKVRTLLDAGATRIRVVAPTFHEELSPAVERVRAAYEPSHIAGASLVFAATDSAEVNDRVARDARAAGALVNRLDEGDPPGDFVTPAGWRQGQVLLAVSAGSPALSVAIRDDLVAQLDDRYLRMADVMTELRPRVRDSGVEPDQRAAIFRELAGDDACDVLMEHGEVGLYQWLAQRHPELKLD